MGSQFCFALIKPHVSSTQIMSIIDRLLYRQRLSPVSKLLFKKLLNTLLPSQGFTHANTPLNSFNSLFSPHLSPCFPDGPPASHHCQQQLVYCLFKTKMTH